MNGMVLSSIEVANNEGPGYYKPVIMVAQMEFILHNLILRKDIIMRRFEITEEKFNQLVKQ